MVFESKFSVFQRGRTLLHEALQQGHSEISQALIDSGVDLNAQDSLKETALHVAAKTGNREAVRNLLQAGANPLLENDLNRTAAALSKVAGSTSLLMAAEEEAVRKQKEQEHEEEQRQRPQSSSSQEHRPTSSEASTTDASSRTHPIPDGTKVLVNFGGKGKEYVGVVESSHTNGSEVVYDIEYSDGDSDTNVPSRWVRPWQKFVARPLPSSASAGEEASGNQRSEGDAEVESKAQDQEPSSAPQTEELVESREGNGAEASDSGNGSDAEVKTDVKSDMPDEEAQGSGHEAGSETERGQE